MSSTTPPLDAFKSAFKSISGHPYSTGRIPLDAASSTLFYRTGNKADSINFANATDADLSALSLACQQATFGVDQKDVLDESYRKAGKMDAADFSTQFSPFTSGVVNTIRKSLLQGPNSEKEINVELYKLNVYGPGSFFKAHIDTPRKDSMFGSLVVVLPTAHEGGSLLFRHGGQETKFDTAAAVSSPGEPHAAFVAFFSDVEHEVSLVTKGYRVTLTYNLYFAKQSGPSSDLPRAISGENALIEQMKTSLSALLADPAFLPDGGVLGFGLSHKYPFNPASTKLAVIEQQLKGSDGTIKQLCAALSLNVSLKTVYTETDGYHDNTYCLLTKFPNLDAHDYEEDIFEYLGDRCGGILAHDDGTSVEQNEFDSVPIVWVKALTKSNEFETPYVAYGNEAMLGCVYGDLCFVAEIGSAEDRKVD